VVGATENFLNFTSGAKTAEAQKMTSYKSIRRSIGGILHACEVRNMRERFEQR